MGDLYQFTKFPKHSNVFFKFTSQAINFEIKAHANACVVLSRKPGGGGDYVVVIGHNEQSWIKSLSLLGNKETKATPDVLSVEEFRKFWISWYGNLICLGKEGETTPLVQMFCNESTNLNYVSFSAMESGRHTVDWKIELPPHMERPPMKSVTGGELYWVNVDAETQFPDDACIGGFEKESLYIIRAKYRGSLTPGKFVSSEGLGYIPWGGEANPTNSFEVLCGYDYTWVPSKLDTIPAGAVVGGYSEDSSREKLYIGRAKHLNHIIPGKVQPSHKVCYIPYDGKEIALEDYEIMVVPDKVRCANKYLTGPVPYEAEESDDDNNDYESVNYDDYED